MTRKTVSACIACAIGIVVLLVLFGIYTTGIKPSASQYEPENDLVSDSSAPAPTPSGSALPSIEDMLAPRGMGNPDAPVQIREFSSLTCSHCANFHADTFPQIKEHFIDTGKVYWITTLLPTDKGAFDGAALSRCVPPAQFDGFVDGLFKAQRKWLGNEDYLRFFRQTAKLSGLNDDVITACLEFEPLRLAMIEIWQEIGTRWGIRSTPSFVMDDGADVIIGHMPFEAMKERIEKRIAEQENGEQKDESPSDGISAE